MARWTPSQAAKIRVYVSAAVGRLPRDDREAFEERAAVMYFDGGLPLHTAEREALRIVRREPVQGAFRDVHDGS